MYKYLLVVCLVSTVWSNTYPRIVDYNEYLKSWVSQVPPQLVHDVSHLAPNYEFCYEKKCQYFYYEYYAPNITRETSQHSVLLVSGMHGDEYLGPHVLLYGYKYFKADHIIYFPMANPSGFNLQKRNTHPSYVDVNRDFPVDKNKQCYQSNAAHILDFLFRQYKFDLTISLHEGQNQIGFNWGTTSHIRNSHTEDYDIQLAISQLMQKVGGQNSKLGIAPFKVGTMNQAIYPVSGSFDDWAYALGKYPELIGKCTTFNPEPYPHDKGSDLFFLLQLGPKKSNLLGSDEALNIEERETSSNDGYVSRGIRIIRQALTVIAPEIQFNWGKNYVEAIARGCPSAVITQLQAFQILYADNMTTQVSLLHLQVPIKIHGNVGPENSNPTVIKYQRQGKDSQPFSVHYFVTFECGQEWQGKGRSIFSKKRQFKLQKKNFLIEKRSTFSLDFFNLSIEDWLKEQTLNDWIIYGIYVICVLAIMSCIFAVVERYCRPSEIVIKQRHQKFEHESEEIQMTGDDLHTARGGIIEENM